MSQFQPRDPDYADRVADAFHNRSIAAHWAGELVSVSPGVVELELSFRNISGGPDLLHRSIVAAFLDDACALAALSLTTAGDTVSTVEYKMNFLAQASGGELVVRAEVLRPGRSITVCRGEAQAEGQLVAKMLATLAVSRPS